MRPCYLEIEGLQSFKEVQKVDFNKLGETGIFGIFGPTGSGKSTVLDAITLALYGNVHRALRGTHGIMNIYSDNLRVVFVFELQKNKQRKTYRVERVYKRKKDSDNYIEAKLARLSDVTSKGNIIIADKPTDVTNKVEELLGLNLNDFTRSVVLPQNKFQEFLLLEKSKRREMLERIFYLEEYGKKLSEKVNRKLNQTKIKLSNIEGGLSALGDISEKTLIEAEKKMHESKEVRDKVDKELKSLEYELNKAKEVWNIIKELEHVCEKERAHLSKQQEIDSMKKQYEESIKAEGLREIISKYRETIKKLSDTESQLDILSKKLSDTQNELQNTRKHYEICRKSSQEELPKLIEMKTKLLNALELRKEADEIEKRLKILRDEFIAVKLKIDSKEKDIEKKRIELSNSDKKIIDYNDLIERLKIDIDYRNQVQIALKMQDEVETAKREKNKYQLSLSGLSKKILSLEEKCNAAAAERKKELIKLEELKKRKSELNISKPDDREAILRDINTYHNIRSVLLTLKSKRIDKNELKLESEELKKNIARLDLKYLEAEKFRNSLYTQLNKEKVNFEEIRKEYEKNSAYILAITLKDGQPCPVCGSVHHPAPASGSDKADNTGILEEKLKNQQELLDVLERKIRESDGECIKLKEQLDGLKKKLAQTKDDLERKEKEYEIIAAELPENIKSMDIEQMEKELEVINNNNQSRLKAIDEWENNLSNLEKEIAELNNTISQQLAHENGIRAELKVNKENMLETENNLKIAEKTYKDKLEEINIFKNRLGILNIQNEIKRIEENDRKVETLRKDIDRIQKYSKVLREQIEKMTLEKQELITRYSALEADGKTISTQKREKEERINSLVGENNINTELVRVDKKIIYIQQEEKKTLEAINKLEASFNALNTQKAALENQKILYEKYVNEEKSQLDKSLEEKGFDSIEHAEKSIVSRDERDKMEKTIKDYDQIRINLQANKEILNKKLNGRNIEEAEWEKINRNYSAKKQEKDESIALYESAKNTFAVVKKNFDIWIGLSKEYKDCSSKHERLEHIQKLLRGNSFVEYVAEERLRYIAKEASQTLGILTKHRYALELDAESGFIIRDNMQGGIHRLVTSLSGGETFLASLSLALALSKQIQLKGQSPLEFFFLDEGFGTLDGNLLDVVIDSLGRLSSADRLIGLISHVPEVKNRVARRLIVEPPTSDGTGSRVYIEKA
jgi:exonuclease SbcC